LNKTYWIAGYMIILVLHVVGLGVDIPMVELISKPMLLVYLLVYFIKFSAGLDRGLRTWVIAALILSWIGDVLLMFQSRNEMFFLAGLVSFLLAHISYIVFFHKIRIKESIRSNAWFLLIIVVYYAALVSFLSPYLGEMKLPVRIYGLVISFMLLLALHMKYLSLHKARIFFIIGAILFVVSDSILAINKFYQPFAGAGLLIMLTYGLAQFSLVQGGISYTSKK
jgi:uncharacterized membrane protein YhhN